MCFLFEVLVFNRKGGHQDGGLEVGIAHSTVDYGELTLGKPYEGRGNQRLETMKGKDD